MIPYLLAVAGAYLIGSSRKDEKFANGGMMAEGGMMAKGGLTDRDIQRLKQGFRFTIFTDTRKPNEYTITIEYQDNSVKYIVRKGGFDGRKVKSFGSEKEALDFISEKVGRKVKPSVD